MSRIVETLAGLDSKQNVRLDVEGGESVEARVSQIDHAPEDHLRIELSPLPEGEAERYQLQSEYDDGEWGPVELRKVPSGGDDWEAVGALEDATSLEESSRPESGDEVGHEG